MKVLLISFHFSGLQHTRNLFTDLKVKPTLFSVINTWVPHEGTQHSIAWILRFRIIHRLICKVKLCKVKFVDLEPRLCKCPTGQPSASWNYNEFIYSDIKFVGAFHSTKPCACGNLQNGSQWLEHFLEKYVRKLFNFRKANHSTENLGAKWNEAEI